MKKAQTDMIGLAIIVFLLVFILLIYLVFSSQIKPKTSIKESTITNNLLNALLDLTPECNPSRSIHKILNQYPNEYCDMPINEFLNKELSNALKASAPKQYGYKLTITKNNQEIIKISENCENKPSELVDNQQLLRYNAKLVLCYGQR